MGNLGNVLWLITLVIVVGCGLWGAAVKLLIRHRIRQALREFPAATDEQLLTGLRELGQAVRAQQERDIARDVHRRTWR